MVMCHVLFYEKWGLYPAGFSTQPVSGMKLLHYWERGIYSGLIQPISRHSDYAPHWTGKSCQCRFSYGKAFIVCGVICLQEAQLFFFFYSSRGMAVNGMLTHKYWIPECDPSWCALLYMNIMDEGMREYEDRDGDVWGWRYLFTSCISVTLMVIFFFVLPLWNIWIHNVTILLIVLLISPQSLHNLKRHCVVSLP